MKRWVCCIVVFIVGAAAGMLLPRLCPFMRQQAEVITRTDTLTLRDTIIERHPVYVTQTKTDTMLVAIRDTVTVRDTAYVVVEREQRHYHGDDYDAWVSGWRPALDSIRVYPETRYITSESISVASRKRWGIGIHAGYGIGVSSGQVRTFPYIGVGISYNLVQF